MSAPVIVSPDAVRELVWEADIVSRGDWRHGQRITYHVVHEGADYLVTLDVHAEDGIQVYGPTTLRPAVKRERTIVEWVEVKP